VQNPQIWYRNSYWETGPSNPPQPPFLKGGISEGPFALSKKDFFGFGYATPGFQYYERSNSLNFVKTFVMNFICVYPY
jgi:hypothetical protein